MSNYFENNQKSFLNNLKVSRDLINELAITKNFNPSELIEDSKKVYPNVGNIADRLIMAKIELSEANISDYEKRDNLKQKVDFLKEDIEKILEESSKKMEEQSYFIVGIERTRWLVRDLVKCLDEILRQEYFYPEFKKFRKEQIGY